MFFSPTPMVLIHFQKIRAGNSNPTPKKMYDYDSLTDFLILFQDDRDSVCHSWLKLETACFDFNLVVVISPSWYIIKATDGEGGSKYWWNQGLAAWFRAKSTTLNMNGMECPINLDPKNLQHPSPPVASIFSPDFQPRDFHQARPSASLQKGGHDMSRCCAQVSTHSSQADGILKALLWWWRLKNLKTRHQNTCGNYTIYTVCFFWGAKICFGDSVYVYFEDNWLMH